MSDTVQIAIITFLSGAVGAICGVIGSHLSSKTSAKAEIQKAALDKYFNSRMNVYSNLMSAFESFNNNWKSEEFRVALYKEISCACLVASDKTHDALIKFQKSIPSFLKESEKSGEITLTKEFVDARDFMFKCLHDDLIHFSLPDIGS